MVSFFLTGATPWLTLIAGWCLIGATPRGQQWTHALTLPHVCDGLNVLLMAVLSHSPEFSGGEVQAHTDSLPT